MDWCKKVRSKRLISVLMAMLVFVMSVTVVMAEEQKEVATSMGVEITCSLDCDFNWNSNDNATAKSSWSGKSGYHVLVAIFSCQNAWSDYELHDVAHELKNATVKASVSGVWKFQSLHGSLRIKDESISAVCALTDW